MLGNQWGPLIINSIEELNVSIVTNEDPAANNCNMRNALIGGRTNATTSFSYFDRPSLYIPNNTGKNKVVQ